MFPSCCAPCWRLAPPLPGFGLDGTFGAGGYTRGLLQAGAAKVIGIDRDPTALAMAASWAADFGPRLRLVAGTFSDLDALAGEPLDGVVLDLGVSSMQIDQPERGFSFQKDGPLDMRMSQQGDQRRRHREPRRPRRPWPTSSMSMARNAPRAASPMPSSSSAPRTRSPPPCDWPRSWRNACPAPSPAKATPRPARFQALRIAVNAEFSELAQGLAAAERALKPGGLLGRRDLSQPGRPHRQALPATGVRPRGQRQPLCPRHHAEPSRASTLSPRPSGRTTRSSPKTRAPVRPSCASPAAPLPPPSPLILPRSTCHN